MNVLFVCVQNAGRSQMAQALFERAAQGRHAARSAGSAPATAVHPEVEQVMREHGFDLSDRRPRRLERADVEWSDVVVTMGCGDACPVIPGRSYIEWDLEDPSGRGLEEVRTIRDEIERRVAALVEVLPGREVPLAT